MGGTIDRTGERSPSEIQFILIRSRDSINRDPERWRPGQIGFYLADKGDFTAIINVIDYRSLNIKWSLILSKFEKGNSKHRNTSFDTL